MQSLLKTFISNLILIFFSLIFILFVVELLLRATGSTPKRYLDISKNEPITNKQDKILGWVPKEGVHKFKPWAEKGKNTKLTVNYDTSRFISEKEEEGSKLIFIGGSVTHGWAINDDETFSYLLQKRYQNIKIYNFAVGGYGGYQSLLNLERVLKKKEDVKFIVYGFIPHHEVRNVAAGSWLYLLNFYSKRGVVNLPYASIDKKNNLIRNDPIKLIEIPFSEKLALSAKIEKRIMKILSMDRERKQTKISQTIINKMNDISNKNNSKFILLLLKDFDDRRTKEYDDFLKEKKISTIKCFIPEGKRFEVPGEGHPNEISHKLISDCIFKKLKNKNFVLLK